MGTNIKVTQVQGRSTIMNDNLLEKKKKAFHVLNFKNFFSDIPKRRVPEQEILKGK